MTPLIEIEDLSIVREGRTILQPLSLSIAPGEHTAILGPNGCGKSTLIKLLLREIYGFAGRGHYRVDGRERWTQRELRTVLGVVSAEPKEPLLGDPTGLDIAVSGLLGTYGVTVQHEVTSEMWDEAREALRKVDALRLADQPVATMSAGEHRRCFIARALVSRPKALVLDEPTTGLDFVSREHFLEILESLATTTTLILVTHHLEELIAPFGRAILMREGRVIHDGPREDVLTAEKIGEAFGVTADRVPLS